MRALGLSLLFGCSPDAQISSASDSSTNLDAQISGRDVALDQEVLFTDSLPGVPCVGGTGGGTRHKLYLQGRKATPDAEGRYPMLEDEAEIVHGEHFLINQGAYVEWAAPLCADIDSRIYFYIPNNEDAQDWADATWELFVVGPSGETLVAETRDNTQYGKMGYNPFEAEVLGTNLDVSLGDVLLVRVTNHSPNWYGIVIFNPPSKYMAWIEVDEE